MIGNSCFEKFFIYIKKKNGEGNIKNYDLLSYLYSEVLSCHNFHYIQYIYAAIMLHYGNSFVMFEYWSPRLVIY